MSYRRARSSSDANQAPIVEALRRVGATVQLLHSVGAGCPDLLVGFRGANFLLEVKNPNSRYGKGKQSNEAGTRERQELWQAAWRGRVVVVRTVEEALAAIGLSLGVPA